MEISQKKVKLDWKNYNNDANPFNDDQLTSKFEWNKQQNKLSEAEKTEELNKIRQRREK